MQKQNEQWKPEKKLNAAQEIMKDCVDDLEFTSALKIDQRTSLRWRKKRIINWFYIGRRVYYHKSDLEKMIADNYHSREL